MLPILIFLFFSLGVSQGDSVLKFYGPSFLASTVNKLRTDHFRKKSKDSADLNVVYNEISECTTIEDRNLTGLFFNENHQMDQFSLNELDADTPEIPIALVSHCFPYNLPGFEDLRLDREVTEGISNSIIVAWDDRRILELNPNFTFPPEKIILIQQRNRMLIGNNSTHISGCSGEAVLSLVENVPFSFGIAPTASCFGKTISVVKEVQSPIDRDSSNRTNSFLTTTLTARFQLDRVAESDCKRLVSSLIRVHWWFLGEPVDGGEFEKVGLFRIPYNRNRSTILLFEKLERCKAIGVDLRELADIRISGAKSQVKLANWLLMFEIIVVSVLTLFLIPGLCLCGRTFRDGSMIFRLEPGTVKFVCSRPPKIQQAHSFGMSPIFNTYHKEKFNKPSPKEKNSLTDLWSVQSVTYAEDVFLAFPVTISSTPKRWKRKTKRTLSGFKSCFNHQNIMMFCGATEIEQEIFVLGENAGKGTLHFFLQTTPFKLDVDVQLSFCYGLAEGLAYLHNRSVVHGSLSSLTVYVTDSLTLKIADWPTHQIYRLEQSQHEWKKNRNADIDTVRDLLQLIYADSYSLGNLDKIDNSSDCYGLGMLFLEIITGQAPYFKELTEGKVTIIQLLNEKKLFKINPPVRVPSVSSAPMFDCIIGKLISSNRKKRISAIEAAKSVKKMRKTQRGIVDIVLKSMESYASDLDECVQERTKELNATTQRMESLLHDVLPPSIASKLLCGLKVEAESFESVSILFSAIWGFDEICACSSPMVIMSFLNQVITLVEFALFDFDLHRVDTIGDTFMIASGVPNRNGGAHAGETARFALALRQRCQAVCPRGIPINLLIGINSGPVTTGVVGSKMPQFCIFGDTVNTASRMQTTSKPGRIQLSNSTRDVLRKGPHIFVIRTRGEIEVKGKGRIKTYWLDSHIERKQGKSLGSISEVDPKTE